jgi:hypothetical protein
MLKTTIISIISIVIIYTISSFYKKFESLKQDSLFFKQEIIMNTEHDTYASKNTLFDIDNKIDLVNSEFMEVVEASLLKKVNLILRIPSLVCSSCYDNIFPIITKKIPIVKRDNFIVIVDLKVLKEYKLYFKNYGLHKNIYAVKQNHYISQQLDKQPFPYLFYNNNNGRYNYLFVINKNSEVRLNEYLNIISTGFINAN